MLVRQGMCRALSRSLSSTIPSPALPAAAVPAVTTVPFRWDQRRCCGVGASSADEVGSSEPVAETEASVERTDADGTTEIDPHEVKEAEVLSEIACIADLERQFIEKFGPVASELDTAAEGAPTGLLRRRKERIDPEAVSPVTPADEVSIAFQKYAHNRRQEGPFIGSELRNVPKEVVEFRKRREIERVMPFEDPYIANETSFRRLPEGARLPREPELRALYPQNTTMDYELQGADCVDFNALGIDEPPQPIFYCRWVPPDYDPNKTYCVFVVLPDGKGLPTDFDDMCANMWQRPAFMKGLLDNNVILLCPIVNIKTYLAEMEHVVIRFIDWVTENYKCENGKPHLIGKGNGAAVAMRVVMSVEKIVHSMIAICGKLKFPLKSDDRTKEMLPRLNGTHTLIFVPGGMFKPSNIYRLKGLADFMRVRPAVRMIHFDLVRDQQVYYAINPIEFWNYVAYFRQYHSTAVSEAGRFYYKQTEWFTPEGKKEATHVDSNPGDPHKWD